MARISKIPAKNVAMTMVNNLETSAKVRQDARMAKDFLDGLHRLTGYSKQSILCRCVLYSAEHEPGFAEHFEALKAHHRFMEKSLPGGGEDAQ